MPQNQVVPENVDESEEDIGVYPIYAIHDPGSKTIIKDSINENGDLDRALVIQLQRCVQEGHYGLGDLIKIVNDSNDYKVQSPKHRGEHEHEYQKTINSLIRKFGLIA